jgi:ferredoxin
LNSGNEFRFPELKRTPSRFRNPIGKYRLHRTSDCIACGKCVEICPYGVHIMRREQAIVKHHYLCVGPNCPEPCYDTCPVQALSLKRNPDFDVMGDFRWTPDLLVSTWYMAEFGKVPSGGLECRIGGSEGGFDKLRLIFKQAKSEHESSLDGSDEEGGHRRRFKQEA